MPAPGYYRGRPASFWITVMSGSAQTMTAGQLAARRRTPAETTSLVPTAAGSSAWEAWARNFFTPQRQHAARDWASTRVHPVGTAARPPRLIRDQRIMPVV